jgi:hypothetical protein
MNTIFMDLDGVIFDFSGHFENTFGVKITPNNTKLTETHRLAEKRFFETMPVIKEGVSLLNRLKEAGYIVNILSSTGKTDADEIKRQKLLALLNNRIQYDKAFFVKTSKDKAQWASKGVLIDDRMKSIKSFTAAGGHAYMFTELTANTIYEHIIKEFPVKKTEPLREWFESNYNFV